MEKVRVKPRQTRIRVQHSRGNFAEYWEGSLGMTTATYHKAKIIKSQPAVGIDS